MLLYRVHRHTRPPGSMSSRSANRSKMTGSKSSIFSRIKPWSRTDDSSTNASDPSHRPSGSRSDFSAATICGGDTNATLASEYLCTWTDVVVEIIERSLAVKVSPLGYEVSELGDLLDDDSLSLSDRFEHTVSDRMVPKCQSHQVFKASQRQGDPFDEGADKYAGESCGRA